MLFISHPSRTATTVDYKLSAMSSRWWQP